MQKEQLLAGIETAIQSLIEKQHKDGYWNGEMKWCAMLTAQYVMAANILDIDLEDKEKIIYYFKKTQNSDGSWGLHPDSKGYLFVTTLVYIASRLLGVEEKSDYLSKAIKWIHENGTPVRIPTWGKIWLAIMNLYSWKGVAPVSSLLWIIPDILPFHPKQLYCHTRLIYQAMSALYNLKYQRDENPLIVKLRQELYQKHYNQIKFEEFKYDVAETDLYDSVNFALKLGYKNIEVIEKAVPSFIKKKALSKIVEQIKYEQEQTNNQGISPVSSLLNLIIWKALDYDEKEIKNAWKCLDAWKWVDDEEGFRIAGALSHAWDTAFAIQALLTAPDVLNHKTKDQIKIASIKLKDFQIVEELPERQKFFRTNIKGGFCFSSGEHRWPVSDCAAEALEAMLLSDKNNLFELDYKRAYEAVEFILLRQNNDGGFSTYEEQRGSIELNRFNPSEMFTDCMVDRSYIECTGSSIRALKAFLDHYKDRQIMEGIQKSISRGVDFIIKEQLSDGSWIGTWGVDFIYGTFHALYALAKTGMSYEHPAIKNGCQFLLDIQKSDGSWGEHWESCLKKRYIEHNEGQYIQTAWALIALVNCKTKQKKAVEKGVEFLLSGMDKDGNWPRQQPAGVFMNTAMLHYELYRAYFPLWALMLAYKYFENW